VSATPSSSIESTLRDIVSLLAQKDYAALERVTNGIRLRASEIEASINEYGRTVALPPPKAFSDIDVIPVRASVPAAYSIRFRLYTIEEGRSDLELQATFIENPLAEQMRVEIDNIIVA
jgi:hypothetical protein